MLVKVPSVAAMVQANAIQTALASSKIALYKSGFTPVFTSVKTDFTDNECDFSGYTTGGKTITAWLEPAISGSNGASIISPSQQWDFVPPEDPEPAVNNVVAGFFVTLAAGDLYGYFPFTETVSMNGVGKVVRIYPEMLVGLNPA